MTKLLAHVIRWLKRDPNQRTSQREQQARLVASSPPAEEAVVDATAASEEDAVAAPTAAEAHALLRQWLEESSGAAANLVGAATGNFDGDGQAARASPLWTREPSHHGRPVVCPYFSGIMEGSGYRGSKDGFCIGCVHLDIFPACKSEADERWVRIHSASHLHLAEPEPAERPPDPAGDCASGAGAPLGQ